MRHFNNPSTSASISEVFAERPLPQPPDHSLLRCRDPVPLLRAFSKFMLMAFGSSITQSPLPGHNCQAAYTEAHNIHANEEKSLQDICVSGDVGGQRGRLGPAMIGSNA